MRKTKFHSEVPKDWIKKKPEATKEMPDSFKELGEKLFEFESNEEGLNVERARVFLREMGLEAETRILFAQDEDRERIDIALLESGFDFGDYLQESESGIYINNIDLIIVFRSKELEELNGPTYTEALAVHELAHASASHDTFLTFDKDTQGEKSIAPRMGLKLDHGEGRGYFLEEGFAENISRDYLAKNMPENQQAKLRALLGFEDDIDINEQFVITTQFGEIPTSLKDFYITKNGEPNISHETLASTAMKLLIERDPSLKNALLEARTNVDGLRQVARKINAIEKGLYMKLRKLRLDQKEYTEALQKINQI